MITRASLAVNSMTGDSLLRVSEMSNEEEMFSREAGGCE